MEIKINWFGRTYVVLLGYKTPWHESMYFFQVIREWYGEGRDVEYAELVFHS